MREAPRKDAAYWKARYELLQARHFALLLETERLREDVERNLPFIKDYLDKVDGIVVDSPELRR